MTLPAHPKDKLDQLYQQLADVRTLDQSGLRQRLLGLGRRLRQDLPIDRGLTALAQEFERSLAACQQRRQHLPELHLPPELPVVERADEIVDLLNRHQVIVLCGATGSGKTTQLPKLAMRAGQGIRGLIGHTQPRRLAARTVAARLADELRSPLGKAVGYKVRFDEKLSRDGYIKLMTDGILLAETQSDSDLTAYDTLIIDEAHERSLNIDFLLGYLNRLLPRRPDLKLIITSATIDPERFSRHFGGAPIVEVSGRNYPVDVRYRPLEEPETQRRVELIDGLIEAVVELDRAGRADILVFLPGERDIREMADALRKQNLPNTEILPLYARLSARHQNLVFAPHNARRIVLATNVAETSLTVPGIRYVIDSGIARIKRYSHRTKVSRLPIEPIAQANADQRAGRCGRTSAGICVRLYSEEDYLSRPLYTDPEILRSNLAGVILQMKVLGLGDVVAFPFIDPPDNRYVNDGIRLLQELGALDADEALTPLGCQLAQLPVDPRIARMIHAAAQQHCLHEVLIIAAGLSIQDPRERPTDQAQAADEKHKKFRHDRSDFLAYLNLWDQYREQQHSLSQRKLSDWCSEHFLSPVRLREWQEVHRELLELVHELGWRVNQLPADYAGIHQALLAGLLGLIGCKQENSEYVGSRSTRFHPHPSSALFKKGPQWLMAGELVETSRLYGRTLAAIEPEWVEQVAAHLVKKSYCEPHWEKKPAQVAAYAQISLYGLVLVARRKINYGPIDPVLAREIFIRHALVEGEYESRGGFLKHNLALLENLVEEEAKVRRRGLLVDEVTLFQFYDQRLPEGIYCGADFEPWYAESKKQQPKLLYLTRDDLLADASALGDQGDYPSRLTISGVELPLSYHFDPGSDDDGVTVTLPVAMLGQLPEEPFEWLVPGLLEEKIAALIRGLPKDTRRHFVPAPQFARAVRESLSPTPSESLFVAIARELKRMTGITVTSSQWDVEKLSTHLRMRFVIVNERAKVLATGRNLLGLRETLTGETKQAFSQTAATTADTAWAAREVKDWDFGDLPQSIEVGRGGLRLLAYPALTAEQGRLELRLFETAEAAEAALKLGLRALIRQHLTQNLKYLEKNLPRIQEMCLYYTSLGSCADLRADLVTAVIDEVFLSEPLPRCREDFEARLETGRNQLMVSANRLIGLIAPALAEYHQLMKQLQASKSPALKPVISDIHRQLERLIYPGFIATTPTIWRPRLVVYLKAARLRIEKIGGRLAKDQEHQHILERWQSRYEGLGKAKSAKNPACEQLRWLLEEYRISLFAQELGAATRVSEKRLEELMGDFQN